MLRGCGSGPSPLMMKASPSSSKEPRGAAARRAEPSRPVTYSTLGMPCGWLQRGVARPAQRERAVRRNCSGTHHAYLGAAMTRSSLRPLGRWPLAAAAFLLATAVSVTPPGGPQPGGPKEVVAQKTDVLPAASIEKNVPPPPHPAR